MRFLIRLQHFGITKILRNIKHEKKERFPFKNIFNVLFFVNSYVLCSLKHFYVLVSFNFFNLQQFSINFIYFKSIFYFIFNSFVKL